ncbi:MAG: (d)CMP kinase [Oscillospiraceae bacterium]|jgi:cytidylate kinase|nr:(d)CMP kinase [Oscillospiraceae bacterium]
MEAKSIAIDGPSGAGKSTLAKTAARELGLLHVDTGALYRAIGLYASRRGVASKDETRVTELLADINITLRFDGAGAQRVLLNGEDVSDAIRTPEVSIYAADAAAMPAVRAFLLETQRSLARDNDVVMDGRDIGTVVLPNAGLKIFLTVLPEVRADRRLLELQEKGVATTYDDVRRDMEYRDMKDSNRELAPLRAAADAVHIDTSELNVEQAFDVLKSLVRERFHGDRP